MTSSTDFIYIFLKVSLFLDTQVETLNATKILLQAVISLNDFIYGYRGCNFLWSGLTTTF